jgi:class 3 adenylate cyclase
MNEWNKALEYYNLAQNEYVLNGNKSSYGSTLSNIGVMNGRLSNSSLAIENLLKAYQIGVEIKNKSLQMFCLVNLAEIYEQQLDFETSLNFYTQFNDLKEELQKEQSENTAQLLYQRRKIEEDEKARQLKLARYQEQEKILHNILPINIADRILNQETFIADHFQSVSVLFMDLVGFTSLSSLIPPKQLVYLLDTIFTKADNIVERYGLEKIKTIGDGYLAVANVTTPLENHQKATALAALQLLETMNKFSVNIPEELGDTNWTKDMKDIEIRIGIHTGEIVAGIIGKNKYTYDLWGDAVNVASRMESYSEAGRIHISEAFAKSIVQHAEFSLIPRGEITVKGKGTMKTFWLEKRI